mmetsp:Transcript_45589/g.143025  ORF Transcript_45589/g.143025 Transcript_45589/m.143025 type:complete len:327 (-) Transcript_45589:43-1023(-)
MILASPPHIISSLRSVGWPFQTNMLAASTGSFTGPAGPDSFYGTAYAGLSIASTALTAGLTLMICVAELWRLASGVAQQSGRRFVVIGALVLTPAVIAVLSFAQTVIWAHSAAPFVLESLYEALMVVCLYQLFMDFLGRTDEEALAVLEEADPQRIWAAPPFCCSAVFPGAAPRVATSWDLALVKVLFFQYFVVFVVTGAIEGARELDGHHLPRAVSFGVQLPSLAGLLYGSVALLRAGRAPLEGRRCHAKLCLLEGLVVSEIVSRQVALHAVADSSRALAVACVVAGLLAVPFALCTRLVYTPDDLHTRFEDPKKHEQEFAKPGA